MPLGYKLSEPVRTLKRSLPKQVSSSWLVVPLECFPEMPLPSPFFPMTNKKQRQEPEIETIHPLRDFMMERVRDYVNSS